MTTSSTNNSDKLNYLEQPIPFAPVAPAGQHVAPEILAAHNAWIKGSKEIAGLMLMNMEPEIQRNLEPLHAHEMLREQEEGQSVSSYVLKMKGYIDNLERLGHPVTLGLGVSLILIGLRKEYDGFVQNYNMHNMEKTVNELHAMLKLHEQTLPKNNAPALHAIRAGKLQKGHWKRNFPQYLAELLKKKKNAASGAGGSGLRASRKLKPRALSLNNMVYFSAIPRDGIFEIDLSNSYTHESSIYAVRNKRAKLDLDSALLWHCRLGHISKKRIEKLQHDGLLDSSDLRAFEKCVSCMSGKMARKPYIHQVERAKDLLGLIYTNVWGPLKILSRQGASYFVTFTDDFSRIRAIRILIAITAYYDYEIWQMDVKTAFLIGYLNEEVYMEQPKGFVNPKYPNR
nr:zinc finger, CCHC-type [Tanacetum cinerariifolium]